MSTDIAAYIGTHLSNWASVAFTWAFGVIVPWWAWAAVGLAGGIAVFILLPAVTPERLRAFLAMVVFSIGAIISAGSWGIDYGVGTERAAWLIKLEDLKTGIRAAERLEIAKEQLRQKQAAEASASRNKELFDVIDQANREETVVAPSTGTQAGSLHPTCPPAIGRDAVERLRLWQPRRP